MVSEYLSYTLWRQREERMPHELEHQRVAQERLGEQVQEQQLRDEPAPDVSRQADTGEALEPSDPASEIEREFVVK